MIGIQVNQSDINYRAGEIAKNLKVYFDQAVSLKNYFDGVPDADLEALGFSNQEVAVLKTAFNDLAYMKATAFDSSNYVKQLYGMGVQ